MTPTNLFGFIFFSVFLAPGLFYNYLRSRRNHESRETTLEELGRILVLSTTITIFSFALLCLIMSLPLVPEIDFGKLIEEPSKYISGNLSKFLTFLSINFVIGMISSFMVDYSIVTLARMKRTSVHQWQVLFNNVRAVEQVNLDSKLRIFWRKILLELLPSRFVGKYQVSDNSLVIPVTRVTSSAGDTYIGFVDLFSEHHEVSERELIISPVPREYIQFLPEEWKKLANIPPVWKRLHLSGSSISAIEVLHWEFPK